MEVQYSKKSHSGFPAYGCGETHLSVYQSDSSNVCNALRVEQTTTAEGTVSGYTVLVTTPPPPYQEQVEVVSSLVDEYDHGVARLAEKACRGARRGYKVDAFLKDLPRLRENKALWGQVQSCGPLRACVADDAQVYLWCTDERITTPGGDNCHWDGARGNVWHTVYRVPRVPWLDNDYSNFVAAYAALDRSMLSNVQLSMLRPDGTVEYAVVGNSVAKAVQAELVGRGMEDTCLRGCWGRAFRVTKDNCDEVIDVIGDYPECPSEFSVETIEDYCLHCFQRKRCVEYSAHLGMVRSPGSAPACNIPCFYPRGVWDYAGARADLTQELQEYLATGRQVKIGDRQGHVLVALAFHEIFVPLAQEQRREYEVLWEGYVTNHGQGTLPVYVLEVK